jgi:parallel beta-helix repeat protein
MLLFCVHSDAFARELHIQDILIKEIKDTLVKTYYVSPTGNDSNNGSFSHPFREIRAAIAVITVGDTVLVADGQYKGFDIDGKNGASKNPITLKATGLNAEIFNTTDRSDNRDTILITSSSFIMIDGLKSYHANRAAMRLDQCNNITICNCTFGNNSVWGIFTDFCYTCIIENNECFGSGTQHGIYWSNSGDFPVIRHNRLHDNAGCGLHMNGDISMGGDGVISSALVENNVIWNNGVSGGAGINMDGVQDSIVLNNILYNNHASGITAFWGDGAQGPKNLKIFQNTIDQASDGRWALLISSTFGSIEVHNNILYNRNLGRGGINYASYADVKNTTSDYNIMDKITPDDSTVYTLAQWQAMGHENNSISADPSILFVNAIKGDYHLKAGSPAIDSGMTISSVTTDIEGRSRPQGSAYDIGAYEYPTPVSEYPNIYLASIIIIYFITTILIIKKRKQSGPSYN